MDKMSISDFQSIDKRFEKDVLECFDYEKSVEMRSAAGGTSKASVFDQISALKKSLAQRSNYGLQQTRESDGDYQYQMS